MAKRINLVEEAWMGTDEVAEQVIQALRKEGEYNPADLYRGVPVNEARIEVILREGTDRTDKKILEKERDWLGLKSEEDLINQDYDPLGDEDPHGTRKSELEQERRFLRPNTVFLYEEKDLPKAVDCATGAVENKDMPAILIYERSKTRSIEEALYFYQLDDPREALKAIVVFQENE